MDLLKEYQQNLGLSEWLVEVRQVEKMAEKVQVEVRDGWEKEAEIGISAKVQDKEWAVVRGLMEIASEDVIAFCLWNMDERDFISFKKKLDKILDQFAFLLIRERRKKEHERGREEK
ncbi:MAG: hypothetical protein V2G33_08225 [bacterium JZ-2024 1]